jgi:hypothetical protein
MSGSSDFWARKLGQQQAPPPHIPQAPQPVAQGAPWWQTPASPHLAPTPQQVYPGADSGVVHLTYQQLKAMRADEMSQEQMEALAELELQFDKYNQACPQCGSNNFLPQGTRIGNHRMGTDKCFECGASSSTLTGSPEPAVGGSGGKPGRMTKQTAHGGAGSYGQHHSQLPVQYLPRNV